MIDILIPVLNRPQNARPVVESIRSTSTCSPVIVFICTEGDEAQRKALSGLGVAILTAAPRDGGDYAAKINWAYSLGESPFVFTAADDLEFTPGWDERILEVAERTGAGMVGSNDDANPLVKRGRHSTHSLFSRAYIDTVGGTFHDGPGIVYCEGYKHQYIDAEAVRAAMDRGQWAFARRSVVRHHHPFYPHKGVKVPMDDTYRKALGDAPFDAALYRERVKAWQRASRVSH